MPRAVGESGSTRKEPDSSQSLHPVSYEFQLHLTLEPASKSPFHWLTEADTTRAESNALNDLAVRSEEDCEELLYRFAARTRAPADHWPADHWPGGHLHAWQSAMFSRQQGEGILNPAVATDRFRPAPSDRTGTSLLPVTVVMNVASGSRNKSQVQLAIEEVLTGSGRDARLLVARRPREVVKLAQQAADSRGGILAAAGGDGTLNAVASVARREGLPFGLIPLGTFNYFGRQLGIPLEPAAAAGTLLEGTIRAVAVGDVNGHLFLNNASIGLYRKLIERRELDKRRFGRNRLVALLSGLAFLLRQHRPYRLTLEIDGHLVSLSTLTVFFGRNALQMEQLGLDEAACVARGELAALALRDVNRMEMIRLALRGALARLENADNLRQYCAMEVRLARSNGRPSRIRVAIDGETVECDLPLRVRSIPDGLKVVVPTSNGAAT